MTPQSPILDRDQAAAPQQPPPISAPLAPPPVASASAPAPASSPAEQPLLRTAPIYPPGWRPPAPPATAPTTIPTAGQRLALAISSLAFFWLMIAIAIGAAQVFGAGFGGWLLAVLLVALVTIAVNVVFSLDLFRARR